MSGQRRFLKVWARTVGMPIGLDDEDKPEFLPIAQTDVKKALDIGCGAGNVTQYLVHQGTKVTAADTSENFLKIIDKTFSGVETILLNGNNLEEIPDSSFDIVTTYSVLHHVPDYLKLVEEMCRVLKKGGVLYIDHEN